MRAQDSRGKQQPVFAQDFEWNQSGVLHVMGVLAPSESAESAIEGWALDGDRQFPHRILVVKHQPVFAGFRVK